MKVVYIAAPCSGDRAANIARAARWVAWAARQGVAPSATWIVLASQWTEDDREIALPIDVELVKRCDELWLVGGRVTAGMQLEARTALQAGIPVHDLTHLGAEPPAAVSP